MRKWLIRKLGGVVIDDFSPVTQARILQIISDDTADRRLANRLLATTGRLYTSNKEDV